MGLCRAPGVGTNAVPDGVFDNGLQHEVRHQRVERVRIDVEIDSQPAAKARPLNLQMPSSSSSRRRVTSRTLPAASASRSKSLRPVIMLSAVSGSSCTSSEIVCAAC